MFWRYDRMLPLIFHEASYDTIYGMQREGPATESAVAVPDETDPERLKLRNWGELANTAFFASWLALREAKAVEFEMNGHRYETDGRQPPTIDAVDPDLAEAIVLRFGNIQGTQGLTQEQKVTIGIMAQSIEMEWLDTFTPAQRGEA